MSIPAFDRSVYFSLRRAVKEHLKKVTFRPIKQIVFTFDPFHHSVVSTRQFLYHLSSHKVLRTNFLCRLKTNIVNDRSEPTIEFTLSNSDKIVLKSANFSLLELFELYQKYVAVHDVAPTAEPIASKFAKAKPSKGKK